MSMSESAIFATLRGDGRIWAIGAIHGEADRLRHLHQAIGERFQTGDQLVYLGNSGGRGQPVRETIDEILVFRRRLMALAGADTSDIVFLRGAQEEMWQKLLQLQFAPNPVQVLQWMVSQGIAPTVEAYGSSIDEAIRSARDGILSLTKWTGQMRQNMRARDGHMALMNALRHAAYSPTLLFVHAGLDPLRPLSAQSDSFWWGGAGFASLDQPYGTYRRVIRGFDRRRGGVQEAPYTVTLDGGAGFGGELVAACFAPDGTTVDLLSA